MNNMIRICKFLELLETVKNIVVQRYRWKEIWAGEKVF